MENASTFLLAKEKTWKYIFNTSSELSENRTEKQIIIKSSSAAVLAASSDRLGPHGSVQVSTLIKSKTSQKL